MKKSLGMTREEAWKEWERAWALYDRHCKAKNYALADKCRGRVLRASRACDELEREWEKQ